MTHLVGRVNVELDLWKQEVGGRQTGSACTADAKRALHSPLPVRDQVRA